MPFGETKVYFDGSHYIAIPHTTRPSKKRPYKMEETITVIQDEVKDSTENVESSISLDNLETNEEDCNVDIAEDKIIDNKTTLKKARQMTKKELFNELYSKYIDCKKKERKTLIIQDMLAYFENEDLCISFVNSNFDRKERNLICRRVRMVRKANLINFNYFC